MVNYFLGAGSTTEEEMIFQKKEERDRSSVGWVGGHLLQVLGQFMEELFPPIVHNVTLTTLLILPPTSQINPQISRSSVLTDLELSNLIKVLVFFLAERPVSEAKLVFVIGPV